MNLGLGGKTAVIAGCDSGTELAIAEGLAAEGVNLILASRDADRLNNTLARLKARYQVQVLGLYYDSLTGDGIEALAEKVNASCAGIDILISKVATISQSDCTAALRLARALLPVMRRRPSAVVIQYAPLHDAQPLQYRQLHNTCRSVLKSVTAMLADELIFDNIRVTTLDPVLVAGIDPVSSELPGYRPVGNRHLTELCVFLCSDWANYTLNADCFISDGLLRQSPATAPTSPCWQVNFQDRAAGSITN